MALLFSKGKVQILNIDNFPVSSYRAKSGHGHPIHLNSNYVQTLLFLLKKNLECPLVSVQKSKYYFQGFLTLKTRVTDITCLQRNISLSKFKKCVP